MVYESRSQRRSWQRIRVAFDRLGDRRTRIALTMAFAAAFSATTAYRASEQERMAAICDHQLSEAQTYEVIQRRWYVDSAREHTRLSEQYRKATMLSGTLLRHADSIRQTSLHNESAWWFDVEAQVEGSVARAIRPVLDFTDLARLEGANQTQDPGQRAEQDVKDLGIANRCTAVGDLPSDSLRAPGYASDPVSHSYLRSLYRHIPYIHRAALDDAFAVVGFVIVLVLFTLSEAFKGRTQRAFDVLAAISIPASVALAVMGGDPEMTRYLLATSIILIGLALLGWLISRRLVARVSEPGWINAIETPATTTTTAADLTRDVIPHHFVRPDIMRADASPFPDDRRLDHRIVATTSLIAALALIAAYEYLRNVLGGARTVQNIAPMREAENCSTTRSSEVTATSQTEELRESPPPPTELAENSPSALPHIPPAAPH